MREFPSHTHFESTLLSNTIYKFLMAKECVNLAVSVDVSVFRPDSLTSLEASQVSAKEKQL